MGEPTKAQLDQAQVENRNATADEIIDAAVRTTDPKRANDPALPSPERDERHRSDRQEVYELIIADPKAGERALKKMHNHGPYSEEAVREIQSDMYVASQMSEQTRQSRTEDLLINRAMNSTNRGYEEQTPQGPVNPYVEKGTRLAKANPAFASAALHELRAHGDDYYMFSEDRGYVDPKAAIRKVVGDLNDAGVNVTAADYEPHPTSSTPVKSGGHKARTSVKKT